jgi:hypothetical protein
MKKRETAQSLAAKMELIAAKLDRLLNGEHRHKERHTGFILMVFPFHEDLSGGANFISSATHDEALEVMKLTVARIEATQEPKGTA